MKQNVKKWSIVLIVFLTACLALMFSYVKYVSKHNAIEVYAEEVVSEVSNDTYTAVNFKNYQKGMKEVNILFNFINYKDDETNQFTSTEIENILSTFSDDLKVYFDIMSQGYLDINIDYCCYTTNNSYSYYLNKSDAEYLTEQNLFLNGVNGRLDYDGTQKSYDFNEYNIRVNCFAGNSGNWSTFLWPHAYYSVGLIMMTEYKQGYPMDSSTMCHELLHVFGVMDLYAYQGDQWFSAQYLDMMGSSNKNTPTNAYFRNKIGWIDISDYGDNTTTAIEEISNEQKGSLTLNLYPRPTSDFSKTIAYKFGENENNGEYFVVEYIIQSYGSNMFDRYSPKTGIVIYRVNPNASGNMNGNNNGNYYNEVIFMGDSDFDISTINYTRSCILTQGETYGNRGESNVQSLVYSSAGGKANLFNGENSEISIYVNSTNKDYATITITFAEDEDIPQKQQINLSGVQWSTASFNYNGTQRSVRLVNLPSTVSAKYSGTTSATNAGVYKVSVMLLYDEEKYELINQKFNLNLTWMINAEFITIKIDNKSSVYGSNLKSLTYSIIGTIYNDDDLNINLQKEAGLNVGTYSITCTAENDNYDIYIQNGTYTITPRVIKVKVNDQQFYLDEFVEVDQQEYTILSGSNSLLTGDVITIIPVNLNSSVAGSYGLTATIDNSNYDLQVENGVLVLKSREIVLDQPSNEVQKDTTLMNKTTIIIVIGSISVVLTGIGVGFVVRRKKREKFQRSLFKIDYNKLDNNDRRRY